MTIQETKDFFATTDFTETTKKKIASVLEGKEILDIETTDAIRALMQEELENDFGGAGMDVSDDPEVKKIEAEYKDKLAQIDADLKEDMAHFDEDMKEMEVIRKQIAQTADLVAADTIRGSF